MLINHSTDVLIIGGGSTGMWAASSAKDQGAEVMLVFKPGGNAILSAAGGHSVVLNEISKDDTTDQHLQDTLESGCYLNDPILVKTMVEKGPAEINRLIHLGVDFLKNDLGQIKAFHAGGHSFPRTLRCLGGHTRQLYKVLLEHIKKQGVAIHKNLVVLDLLVDANQVYGALAMDTEKKFISSRQKLWFSPAVVWDNSMPTPPIPLASLEMATSWL